MAVTMSWAKGDHPFCLFRFANSKLQYNPPKLF
ncbi:hypothetical protein CCACVL1_16684 [Corchorus capsularis]|uniref:Uncharacterized protein n=1 Tax=Corchorus capsularis TaxID=210143 RepID=A0A1R3HVV9_COCAP|nr:hypothetical protein CCACVL1_16684 [Corchorus capsularis]